MQALCDWTREDRRHLIGVFTDIDDTLTTDGAITPDALAALHALKAAGLADYGKPGNYFSRQVGQIERLLLHALRHEAHEHAVHVAHRRDDGDGAGGPLCGQGRGRSLREDRIDPQGCELRRIGRKRLRRPRLEAFLEEQVAADDIAP